MCHTKSRSIVQGLAWHNKKNKVRLSLRNLLILDLESPPASLVLLQQLNAYWIRLVS